MPVNVPVPAVTVGQVYTTTLYELYLRQNMNKLLNSGHRVLTVAQFAALTTPEGTKGVVAPDEVYLEVDATNGVEWHLGFESTETTNKWRYLGGPPLEITVSAAESTASTTFVALTTAGPSIALPRAGDYDIESSMFSSSGSASTSFGAYMSYDIGGTAAVDADAVKNGFSNASSQESGHRHRRQRKTGLTSVTLTSKYRVTAGTGFFGDRRLAVTPARIRHDA